MRKFVLMIAAQAALSGCVSSEMQQNVTNVGPVPMTPKFTATAENAVRAQLKDPYSAVFGETKGMARLRNGDREIVICGYVNAKNSFGGYIGMQPYIGVFNINKNRFDLVAMGGQSEYAHLHVKASCSGAGIPIS